MWGEGWGAVGEGCGDCGWCWALIFLFFYEWWKMLNIEWINDFMGYFSLLMWNKQTTKWQSICPYKDIMMYT